MNNIIEKMPTISPVAEPLVFYAERMLILGYEIAECQGGGSAIVHFNLVESFKLEPISVESLSRLHPDAKPWSITDIGSVITGSQFHSRGLRWLISFRDVTLSLTFTDISDVVKSTSTTSKSMMEYMAKL